MTILVDTAEGSKLLLDFFDPKGIAEGVANLPTDVMFMGNGPVGSVSIGIEHKRLPDALECIKTGRLADVQVPKQKEACDISLLMIETGIIRKDPESGLLQIMRGKMWQDTAQCGWGMKPWLYRDFVSWLWSVQFIGGVWLLPFVKDKPDSCWLIQNMYWWWQERWEDHKSFKQMFVAGAPPSVQIPYLYEAGSDVSLFRRIAAGLPHVGWEISATCEQKWGSSVVDMVNASEHDWSELIVGRKGKQKRRFGKRYAKEVVDVLHGRIVEKKQ